MRTDRQTDVREPALFRLEASRLLGISDPGKD